MLKLAVFVGVLMLSLQCEAKRFERCDLVRELRRQGFPEDKMRDWVCLVEHESFGNTHKIHTNSDRSGNYGLFQINNRNWCSITDSPGKECNVKCSDLITDDITKASACAKKIYESRNFLGWNGWKKYCAPRRGSLPDISSC